MKKINIVLIAIALLTASLNTFAKTNTYPFEVKISGKGDKAIIFIPGFACSGKVWDETKVAYEKDFTCYTLTMAGFAGVPAQEQASFANWEKAVARYITENKISHPIIIGHSMGGGLALALAADYPQLIAKIIVVDALPCLAALMDASFKAKENNDCSVIAAQITETSDEQFKQMQKTTMPMLLADTSKIEQVVGWSVQSDRKTFAEMYCDFSNTDLREKITTIKCPALILLESYFVNFKPAIAAQYKNCSTASLQYATKGLHFIMYDDAEWFNKQVNAFINQ